MSEYHHSESIFVARTSGELYDLVSDVTRTGEWSPICRACWWDENEGPFAGAWFTGRNQTPTRTWITRSQVAVADPGREFAWLVGDGWVRWGYTMAAVDGGTELTETWTFLPKGLAGFREKYGDDAPAQILDRVTAAHDGIPVTLAAIKRIAESG